MPWKESHYMDERVRFISRLLGGDRMTDLCGEFGISRKTGYKFWNRYLAEGVRGLANESRKALCYPNQTPKEIEELVVCLREKRPGWGPKKLKEKLEARHFGVKIPAKSTIGEVIKRYGLPTQKRRSKRSVYRPTELRESKAPNDIWSVDFKGQFRLGNREYCYPLTASDNYSRYFLGCDGLSSTGMNGVFSCFENIFIEYGLPKVIRSDNGTPFAAGGINGWSRLSVWWLRLGIELERIEPGHPEQNGRHERLHRTLKQETTRPAAANLLRQQEIFDMFRKEYNEERPHEGLKMQTPASIYRKSERKYPRKLDDLEYPLHDYTCRVHSGGVVYLPKSKGFYITAALAGEMVGLREVDTKLWLVSFMHYDLGYYNEGMGKFNEFDKPQLGVNNGRSLEKVLPMSPV